MEKLYIELDKLTSSCEEIAGNWNGEDSGIVEDRATTALDIQEKIGELKELIDYLNTL